MITIFLALTLLAAPQAERGAVTGQIRLATGNTKAGIRVAAMPAPTASAPAASLTVLDSIGLTDAAGRYRLDNLAPGSYYITAGLVEIPTYFPGTRTAAGATLVVVRGGVTTEAVDFRLVNTLGVRVSGRIPKAPGELSAVPVHVLLRGMVGGSNLETIVDEDGTFQFLRVPPGGYRAIATPNFGLTPMNVVVVDRDVSGVNLPFADPRMLANGFKVSGALTETSALSMPNTPVPAGTPIALFGQSLNLESVAKPDGSFEFRNVPPGTYTVRGANSGPPGANPGGVTIVVTDRDLTGVTIPISISASTRVTGVISVEGGSSIPTAGLSIQVQRGAAGMSTFAQSGTFSIPYDQTQGDHYISISNLPLGYFIKSIDYAGTDLTKAPLKPSGQPGAQIEIIIGKLPPDAIRGVRVSGKLSPATTYPPGLTIIFTAVDSNGPLLEAPVASDGAFEFPKVPPGSYRTRVSGASFAGPSISGIVVGDQDRLGLTIDVLLSAQISGQVWFVDRNGRPMSVSPTLAMITYSYTSSTRNGRGSTSIRSDGTFGMALPEGIVRVSANLPEGYTLKSMTLGSIDLTKESLQLTSASVSGIEAVVEFAGERP